MSKNPRLYAGQLYAAGHRISEILVALNRDGCPVTRGQLDNWKKRDNWVRPTAIDQAKSMAASIELNSNSLAEAMNQMAAVVHEGATAVRILIPKIAAKIANVTEFCLFATTVCRLSQSVATARVAMASIEKDSPDKMQTSDQEYEEVRKTLDAVILDFENRTMGK